MIRFCSAFASLLVLAAFSLVLFPVAESGAQQPAAGKKLKILYVCGGCCHDYDTQKVLIAQGLMDRANVEVDVVQQGGSATDSKIDLYKNPDWSKGYDAVIHHECFSDVKDPEWQERILKPHREGLPAVVVHCAMHCYRTGGDEWFKFCGVTSRRHGAAYGHTVFNRDPAHPVMAEFGPAWSNPAGELYWIEKVWPDCHPLAWSKNAETGAEEVCVWTNQYGKGRVFGTTLGHHNETVGAREFLDLLTRGTLWAAGSLDAASLKADPVQPRMEPVNLALGKPAQASSTQKGNEPQNAFDDNPATRWCNDGPSFPASLTVDLGKRQELTGCDFEGEVPKGRYQYKIEGSSDGSSWNTLADGLKNTRSGRVADTFSAKEIQYVRITLTGRADAGWPSLWEFRVFGTEMRQVDPDREKLDAERALLGTVQVPAEFEKTIFGAPPAVNYPVFVAAATDGTLFVSVDKNGSLARDPHKGMILRVRDLDGDGRGDEVRPFVADVDSPRGLVWDHDRLYVMHPPHLSAFIDKDGDGISDEQKVLVKNMAFTFKDRPADHTTNGVTLGIDGWLYIAVGDFGFLEAESTDGRKLQCRGGGVVRVRPDGTGLELYSFGTRNILEVAMSPLLDGFTRDNTNDGGGWDIRFHHFTGMENHGYPSLYMNFGGEIIQPLNEYGGGSGCGAVWLDEPGFPDKWRNIPMTACWGRSFLFGHTIAPKGATFSDVPFEGVGVPKTTDGDADGMSRLYVSSWKEGGFNFSNENVGYVAMVKPKGYVPEPLPDFEKSDTGALVKLLESPSGRRRMEAQRTLIRRGLDDGAASVLKGVAADDGKPLATRVAAVFALKQGMGTKATPILNELGSVPPIRAWVVRALADREDQLDGVKPEVIMAALSDGAPRAELEGMVAVARLGYEKAAGAVAEYLGSNDPVLAHTAYRVLGRMKAAAPCLAVLDSSGSSDAALTGAARALQLMHVPAVADELAVRLANETQPARKALIFSILARLVHRDGEWKGDSWGTRPDTSGPYYQPARWEASDRIGAALEAAFASAGPRQPELLKILSLNKVKLGSSFAAIITAAKSNPAMRPALLDELQAAGQVPAEALTLVIAAATDTAAAVKDRTAAIQLLTKVDGDEAFQAALDGLLSFDELRRRDRKQVEQAERAFYESLKLENHHQKLEALAAKLDGKYSPIAEGALIALISRKNVGPEAKQQARANIDAGWTDPKRRIQVLQAIADANTRDLADLVLKSAADPEKNIADFAKELAKKLNLEPAGPAIETMKVADVMAEVSRTKGDIEAGKQLFTQLSCVTCHTVSAAEPQRGPFLGTISDTYRRPELAEMILDPNKTIAQGFATVLVTKKDGSTVLGFITQESAEKVTMRDIAGTESVIPAADIAKRDKLPTSMMPPGLTAKISVKDLASLLDYLESLSKKK